MSIVGLGVQHVPGLAAQAFAALERAGIKIEMVTTSQVRITCLIAEQRLVEAARLLHTAFGLDVPQEEDDDAAVRAMRRCLSPRTSTSGQKRTVWRACSRQEAGGGARGNRAGGPAPCSLAGGPPLV